MWVTPRAAFEQELKHMYTYNLMFFFLDAAIFRAKNVSADFLELRVPIWSSDLCFPDKHSSALVAYSNRYGHVRYVCGYGVT